MRVFTSAAEGDFEVDYSCFAQVSPSLTEVDVGLTYAFRFGLPQYKDEDSSTINSDLVSKKFFAMTGAKLDGFVAADKVYLGYNRITHLDGFKIPSNLTTLQADHNDITAVWSKFKF